MKPLDELKSFYYQLTGIKARVGNMVDPTGDKRLKESLQEFDNNMYKALLTLSEVIELVVDVEED